jgi:hypothetical protein
LQNPSRWQLDVASVGHSLSGSVPFEIARQRPLAWPVLVIEQAMQSVPHPFSQQYPSTQAPDVHCALMLHIVPLACVGMHAPPEQ